VLITLTGAFKNAGDYLIGHRARALLKAHTNHEIVDLNRKQLNDQSYELLNSASAVLLTGGPAYQSSIYPGVYNLDLDRIKVPVIPYGLGWKGKLNQAPEEFRFEPQAQGFVQRIHDQELRSSARDHLTTSMLSANGVQNVLMTGCPAWYDEKKLSEDYVFQDIRSLVFSMPAVPQSQVPELLRGLAKRFPKAKKYLVFNAGYKSTRTKNTAEFTRWNYLMMARGKLLGFTPVSLESDFAKFESLQSAQQLHIGYRVHSHLFSLSQRITTMLIAEDSRGVGQAQATGLKPLLASADAQTVLGELDELLTHRGEPIAQAVVSMRERHGVMLEFISQLARL
jgi:hypothetical protein